MNPRARLARDAFLRTLESVSNGLSTREFIEQSSCFTADTVIHTLGGDFTVAELLKMGRTEFKVFSADGDRLKIGDAFALRLTKKGARVYEVTFDTGQSIKLTSDHLIMMRNGSYSPVKDLRLGDSVMPFNHRYTKNGYHIVCEQLVKKRVSACRWVFSQVHGGRTKGLVIHHRDFNPGNDDPNNLVEVTRKRHALIHLEKNGPPMHHPGAAAKISKLMKGNKRGVGPKPGTARAMIGNQHAKGNRGYRGPRTERQLQALADVNRRRSAAKISNNHKVASVVYVGRADVYDLSVHKYHNFAANGVFIHNCFVFRGGKVWTFNDEVACQAPSGLPKSLEGAVRAEPLKALLAKMTEEEVEVEQEEAELVVRGKSRSGRFTLEAKIALPIDTVEEPEIWTPLPEGFSDAISVVGACTDNNASQRTSYVHLHPKWLEACDNFQLCRWKMKLAVKSSVLVRFKALGPVAALGVGEFAETEGWVHFRVKGGGLRLSCRRYVDDFPDLAPFLKVEGTRTALPKGLEAAAERAEIFTRERPEANQALVRLTPGRIKVCGIGINGRYEETRKIEYAGPKLEFLIAPKILAEIVKNHQECEISRDRLAVKSDRFVYVSCLTAPESNGEAAKAPALAPEED